MPREGVMVDRMRPHYVKLKKGRLIRKWAMEKGNDRVRQIAEREGSIFVRPHPFIDKSLVRVMVRIPVIIQRHADRSVSARV